MQLTTTERFVANRIAEGHYTDEIAREMRISRRGVYFHTGNIHKKLGTRNHIGIAIAVLQGIK